MGAGEAAREGPQGPPPGALETLQRLATVPGQFKELPTEAGWEHWYGETGVLLGAPCQGSSP